ncbi:MAG: DNA primase [Deltaproteobacteria bacterium]|nr:DNA primase [Deltaproteobacteria bacterium]
MDFSDKKEEIRRAADIVQVIGQYVQLKKRGQNYIGLCPFHSEKTPSFTVSQEKQIYHCFGCGRGGDIFNFWMEYHNLTFPQALKDLARQYNVSLPEYNNSPGKRKESDLIEFLFEINELAGRYFHDVLIKRPDGKPGRDYFSERNLSQDTISAFRLGYAVNSWDGLVNFLKRKDIPLDKAAKAGLIVSNTTNGYYDRFRGRIIFPIFNLNHQIIGFGGRVLDDSLPKYLNSPDTPLYHKGRYLYGLDSAYKDVRTKGFSIIVEGYMDLLALRQHGVTNVVATLGTALTADQVRRLKSYAKKVVVLFDSDDAGKQAALKTFPLFLNEDLSAKVLVLPGGEDPDSFINKYGVTKFDQLLGNSIPIFDFYLDQALANEEPGVDGRIRLIKDVLPIFMELEDRTAKFLYIHLFSEKTGIDEGEIWEELRLEERKLKKGSDLSEFKNRLVSVQDAKKYGSDLQFLKLLAHYPEKIDNFRDQQWELIVSDQIIVKIIKVLMEKFPFKGSLYEVEEYLDDPITREQLRVALISNPYDKDIVDQAVGEFLNKISKMRISQSISRARAEGNIEAINHLIKEKQGLDLRNKRN